MLPLALNYVSSAIGADVKASRIDISFFDELILEDVWIEDSQGDTLAFFSTLNADISLFSYFNKELHIDELNLTGSDLYLKTLSGSAYNFDHIVDHLSSAGETTSADNKASWIFDVEKLVMEETNLSYLTNGYQINTEIKTLEGTIKDLLLSESKLHLSKLVTDTMAFSYEKSSLFEPEDDDAPTPFPTLPFNLEIDEILLSESEVYYNSSEQLQAKSTFDPQNFLLENIDLKGQNFEWNDSIKFDLKQLVTNTSDGFEIQEFKSAMVLSDQVLKAQNSELKTSDSHVKFDTEIRYNSFDDLINRFLQNAIDVNLSQASISKNELLYFFENENLPHLNLEYLTNLDVSGKLVLDNKRMRLQDLSLSDGKSLNLEGGLYASDIENIGNSGLRFDIGSFKTSQAYLERLLPSLKFPEEINDLGSLRGKVSGTYTSGEIIFSELNVSSGSGTTLNGRGKISDFENEKGPSFDLTHIKLNTGIASLFSDKLEIPERFRTLNEIEYEGSISGTLNDLELTGTLDTEKGKTFLDGKIAFNEDYTNAAYGGEVITENLDLGFFLQDSTLGNLNFEGEINGEGLTPEEISADVNGKIFSFEYDGEVYRDIEIDGNYKDDIFEGTIISEDEKLQSRLDGKLDLSGDTPLLDITMDMQSFDLNKLGISDSLMVLGGIFKGTIKGSTADDIIGEGQIENFSIRTNKGFYTADKTIFLKSEDVNKTGKALFFNSPFAEGEIKGKFKPSNLIRFVKNYIKAYIPLESGYDEDITDNLEKYFEENEDQKFILSLKTRDINPFLEPFFGDKMSLKSTNLSAYFSSNETRLDLKGNIDSLEYNGILLQRGSYFFDGRKSFINGNINIEDISADNEILIPYTTINTSLNNKVADFELQIANENDVKRLSLIGDLTRTDEYIVIFKDSMYLNGNYWQFSPYNRVFFGDNGLFLQDLKLSKEQQAITLYTDENENGTGVEMLFNDFTISELTAIIDKKNDYLEGNIEGKLMINSLYSKPFLTANLTVEDLVISGYQAGYLYVTAYQNVQRNSVNSQFSLVGLKNDASLDIEYGLSDLSTKGNLRLQRLEMDVIDPYLTDIFRDSKGYLSGDIVIGGSLRDLGLNGKIITHDVQSTPIFTNSRYTVEDTEVIFTDDEIDFGSFTLKDVYENEAKVKGKIYHKNLRNSILDLNVNTDIFEFLNTTDLQNELFYGNVFVKGNAQAYGPIDEVKITGAVSAVNSSKLTVSPLSLEAELLADNFIIYSGDPRKNPTDSLQFEVSNNKKALPLTVDMKIEVENDSEFTMIMNPVTGDQINCFGTANLNFKLDKDAEMELFGTYSVSRGKYGFSYTILNKDFEIQPQSTVSFNGDPLDGTLNVQAIYEANASVYDLIKFEQSELTDAQKTEAQRKMNLNVILDLTKSIQSPEIKFSIATKEDEVQSSIADLLNPKLAQLQENPDELNKQVFSLLLFDNFMMSTNAETVFETAGTDLAISSVSDLLSQQISKLTNRQIGGFDVDFGFNTYSSDFLASGQEGFITQFDLGVKRNLFDDRLTIRLGTNINLETSSDEIDFNTIASDFIVDYKFVKDGSFRFTGFRKSSFDRLTAEGNSSINGIGLFIRREFGEIKKKNE